MVEDGSERNDKGCILIYKIIIFVLYNVVRLYVIQTSEFSCTEIKGLRRQICTCMCVRVFLFRFDTNFYTDYLTFQEDIVETIEIPFKTISI